MAKHKNNKYPTQKKKKSFRRQTRKKHLQLILGKEQLISIINKKLLQINKKKTNNTAHK